MTKEEHGKLLRLAMADQGFDNRSLADAAGVGTRTVTNWRQGETMPSQRDLAVLRKILGPYDQTAELGAVEAAVRRSPLVKWRQDAVISTYEKHLWDQGREEVGTG